MTSSRYCSPSTQLSFTPVEGCCDPCAGMRMSSCSCCPSVSGCSCGPQNQQMSKLAAFALGGNGCCEPVKSCRISAPQPPPYFSCPPPIRPRNVGAAACSPPPAFICSGPARGNSCGKTPSERLKNVDVLEELCYYVPGQCCPPVDCYNVCNCCGESEMLNCCCNGSSCPPPPPNPVKYSRRQRFAFQNERPQPQPQPSWPFDPMETCPCPPDPCQQRPPQRFCEKKPAPRPDPCGSNSRMPSQTGLYYFDRRRKIFIPENELPLPSRCVTQASRSRSAAPRKPQRQETFEPNGTNDTQNCPPYEEIEIIEDCANEEDQQQQVIIQPVIQPVIMPNPNCNQSNNNNCNPCCNPNPCNPCCNPNPCNPCCNPPNPCNPFCNPNPCNPCCNPFMGMGNPCGPCMPMCMPMCPPPPPQQMMGPPPMNPLMAMLMNPKLMKKMNKHRKKSKSRKHHRHHRKTKETVIDYDSNGYPDEYDHDRSQQNSRSRSTKSGGRHTGSGSGGRGAEQDADHRDGDGRHKPNADHRDGDGRHKPTPRQNSRGANNSRNAENPQSSQKSRPPTYSSKGHSSNIIVPGKPGEFFGNAGPPSTAYEETLGTEMNAQSTNGPENTLSYAEVRLPKGTTTHQVNLTANTQDPNHHHAAEVGVIQGPEANAGMKQTAGLAPAFVETTPQGETAEYYFIPEGQDAKVLVDNKKP